MNDVDARMCTDISIIISMMPSQMQDKISQKLKDFIENNKAENYSSNINPTVPLKEQILKKETKAMLGIIYRDYLCSEEQRRKLLENEKTEIEEYERELREKYNPDNIFKNKNNSTERIQDNISTETAIVEYKEKNFIQKLFDKIKHLFRRNN